MSLKPGTKEYRLVVEEKGCYGELHTLGKISYFVETFYDTKLTDEDMRKILPVENPTKTKSYQNGYAMGKILVENGFTKEHYIAFYHNLRMKMKERLELIEPTKKLK